MGVYYDFYTEALIDDKWVCINGKYYNTKKNDYDLVPTLWGQSYMAELYNKIYYCSRSISPDKLSDELRNYLHFDEDVGDRSDLGLCCVSYATLRDLIPKDTLHDNNYYVPKNSLFAYLSADAEDIYDYISASEYSELSEDEKKAYMYYEWDSTDGWLYNMRKLLNHVDIQANCVADINYMFDIQYIRVIAMRS